MRLCAALLAACAAATPALAAVEFTFPGPAVETASRTDPFTSYKIPVGPYADGIVQSLVAEGQSVTKAWKVNIGGGSTLVVMDSLRQQLEAMGFELLFECNTERCGGFDFRFETRVLPDPVMHVDLGDFRYLAAQRLGGAVPEYVSLFVSRGADRIFVQMILVGSLDGAPVPSALGGEAAEVAVGLPDATPGTVEDALLRAGRVVLDDLEFETGSSSLGEGEFQSLTNLSAYLKANPDIRVALVGHTDAVGALQGNIALSRQRAQSVLERLVSKFEIPRAQLEADGVGYLAPRASNLTEEGRTQNRRVEAVVTSTEG